MQSIKGMFTKECKCGKKMIAVQTPRISWNQKTKEAFYYYEWWCGGCGRHEEGEFSRNRAKESDLARWERANS